MVVEPSPSCHSLHSPRSARVTVAPLEIAPALRALIAGQDEAIDAIAPYVDLYESGLAPAGRPAGVFLLLGPTGTGKTRTVEALAAALHGSDRQLLRIDCGEYQLDHETAKLIGAPPGYLGHRETQPVLSQQKLNAVTSDRSALSLVLFDEIEKAAPSFMRILLGVLDRAVLRLGDGAGVSFENSLIFLTSNLGARGMLKELGGGFGLAAAADCGVHDWRRRLHGIATHAAQRRFAPEFLNRIDEVVTYQPLEAAAIERILDLQLDAIRQHIRARRGSSSFDFALTSRARRLLVEEGASREYGARELKRVIHRRLLQPLAKRLLSRQLDGTALIGVDLAPDGELEFSAMLEAA